MKYNTEVDSENRNISPRNDLLRNLKCVGIIQIAAARAHTLTRFRIYNYSPVPICPDARAGSPRTV